MSLIVQEDEQSTTVTSEAARRKTVLIVGPPWPRSGTGRGMQNQVDYYRERGYFVVFICVPVHCSFSVSHPDWTRLRVGMEELGADRTFFAYIDNRRFKFAKYREWLRHSFRGTALDWIVFTAASARLPVEVRRFLSGLQVSLVHVNHVFTLQFTCDLLRSTIRSGAKVPMIVETHDIQAVALEDRGEINPWTHRPDTLDALVRSEVSQLEKAPVLLHVSVDDLEFFERHLPTKRHVLSMPTINKEFAASVESSSNHGGAGPIDLLFVAQSTAPNAAAVEWFFGRVWPHLSAHGYTLQIVGGIGELVHETLPELYEKFRSHFTGLVADLIPFYSAARCVIAPMVSGTGISCKTIEALAVGKPFVGTSKAYRGMPMNELARLGLKPHDDPEGFANAIVCALGKEREAAAASRAAYSELFCNQVSFNARDEAVRMALASRRWSVL